MACGVPVVATRVGAFEELIAEGETGVLVDPEDIDGLTAGIADYLDDAERRRVHGIAARDRVVTGFRLEDEAAALNAIYRRLLSKPGPEDRQP
jgi:mannosyltransferase